MSDRKSGLTHSGIEAFRRCPKRYWFANRAGGRGIASEQDALYFHIGSAYHAAMEFVGKVWEERKNGDISEILGNGIADVIQGYAESKPIGEEMRALVLTHARGLAYAHADLMMERCQHWDFVAVEKDFEAEVGSTKIWGRVDAVVSHSGRTWLVEHKALSSVPDNFIEIVPKDAQVLRYAHALQQSGYPISGVIYTVGKKCGLRQKKAESREEFVKRVSDDYEKNGAGAIHHFDVILDRGDISRCAASTAETLEEIHKRDESGIWTQWESGCDHKYGTCEFYRICLTCPWSGDGEVPSGFVLRSKRG